MTTTNMQNIIKQEQNPQNGALNNKQLMKQLMQTCVPLYIGFELRMQQKPIKCFQSSYEKVQLKINNIFQEYGQINLSDSIIKNIYEGIVDMKRQDNKAIMIFKNTVDAEFIKLYYAPYQIEELYIFSSTDRNLNILIIQFDDTKQ